MTASTASPVAPATGFPRGAAVTLVIWLGSAVAAGATGFLIQLPFPGPQILILALIAAVLVAVFTNQRLSAWIDSIPLRVLVGVNAIRFVGIAFLVLAAQGRLNPLFAERAGWGDIAAALGAIVLVVTGVPRTSGHRAAYHAWNVFGLLDLVVAVGTATIVTLQAVTPTVEAVLTLPLILVPTILVPLLVANHVLIFRRLRSDGR